MLQCRILHYTKSAPPKSADLNTALTAFAPHTHPVLISNQVSPQRLRGADFRLRPGLRSWRNGTRRGRKRQKDNQLSDLTQRVNWGSCTMILSPVPCINFNSDKRNRRKWKWNAVKPFSLSNWLWSVRACGRASNLSNRVRARVTPAQPSQSSPAAGWLHGGRHRPAATHKQALV
jgi:hypothetical protein